MRTRATGHSPGGFHVLPSPKRVRRQPPTLTRASQTTKEATGSSKEEAFKIYNGHKSEPKEISTHANGYASNYRPNPLVDVADNEHKSVSSIKRTGESNSEKQFPDQKCDSIKKFYIKNSNDEKRDALAKKLQSDRNMTKRLSHQASTAVHDIDLPHKKTSCCPVKMPARTQPAVPILGKRNRNASSSSITACINDTEFANQKRPRISERNSNRLDSHTGKSLALVPYNHTDKNSSLSQNYASRMKSSQQLQNGSPKGERTTNFKSSQSRFIESPQDLKNSSSTKDCSISLGHTSNVNKTAKNYFADRTNNVETHLKQGMQSIMSRMNKYQYQPLTKNSYENINSGAIASKEPRDESVENNLNATGATSTSRSQRFATNQCLKSRTEFKEEESAQDDNCSLGEEVKIGEKQSEREKKIYEAKQARNKLGKQKDRRMEVEKLFRSIAPNASYQNILRAVADWAVHNPSALPTREEALTYIELSKAPDPTELFTVADRPLLRNSSSRIRKESALSNRSNHLVRENFSRNKKGAEGTQNLNSIEEIPYPEKDFDARHIVFSNPIKGQQVDHGTADNIENSIPSSTVNSSILTTQSEKSLPNHGWGLLNAFKSLVSTPFKALGLGFKDNNEAVKEVTKDINFVFKPSATPKPGGRLAIADRVASKYGNIPQTPTRLTTSSRPNRLQSDHSYRYRTPNNQHKARRTVTEKQRSDLRREQDSKKLYEREKESYDDTNRRRKIPSKHVDETLKINFNDITPRPSQTSPQLTLPDNFIEEWPPNLDPYRSVVGLQQASHELPRGPNGEDVATMLCKGWLISKHRDSFIREIRVPTTITSSNRRNEFESTGPPHASISRNTDVKMCDILDNAEISTKINSKSNYGSSGDSLPGRSYGFQYDDDSSSDEEETDGEKGPDLPRNSVSDLKNTDPFSSGKDRSISNLFKPKFEINRTTVEGPNLGEISKLGKTNVKSLSQSIDSPYSPRMPSSLRNVAASSPHTSDKITNPNKPFATEDSISQKPAQNNSLTLFYGNDSLSQPTETGRDWSFTFRVDPKMALFNPTIIAAVEALPQDSIASIQLPSFVG